MLPYEAISQWLILQFLIVNFIPTSYNASISKQYSTSSCAEWQFIINGFNTLLAQIGLAKDKKLYKEFKEQLLSPLENSTQFKQLISAKFYVMLL